jgi:hypothetical protein
MMSAFDRAVEHYLKHAERATGKSVIPTSIAADAVCAIVSEFGLLLRKPQGEAFLSPGPVPGTTNAAGPDPVRDDIL